MLTGEVKNKIKALWDVFYANGLTSPLTVLDQITYLLFIKILDDNEIRSEANAAAFGGEYLNPVFDKDHQNCRWHIFKNYSPQDMFDNMTNNVFPFIKNGLTSGSDTAFSRYMDSAIFLIPTPLMLVKVVDGLDELDLHNKDMMGDVYEFFLSELQTGGKEGAFRTPRHIIGLIVDLMKPTLSDVICDPAMGSAGFLSKAAQYINEKYEKDLMKPTNRKHYNTELFSGFDTDQTMLRIGAMNMMLHGVEAPNIKRQDSLSSENEERGKYSLIMANPPFSGSLIKETISKDLLAITSTTKTELLFIAAFIKMLKVGGRCASIVPDGVLFGSSNAHKAIRKELVDNNRLEAVISMPSGVFQPYAGVKTSIMIFTKTGNGGTDNVWFYDMTNDGYTLDVKRSEIPGSDIPDIIERFNNLDKESERTRKDKSFFVPVSEIRDNDYDLTLNKYKEIEKEVKVYRDTKTIMDELVKLEEEYQKGLEEIKELLCKNGE